MALQTKTLPANGSKGHHKFTLTVTENSTSVANNTSSVSWSFVISPITKGYDWVSNSGKVKYSVVINGNTYSGIIATYDGSSTVTIKSGTETCAHNADGSKTLSYSFSITDTTGWSFAPGNVSASSTMALTAIPRQATISAAPNFNDEQNPTITYSNPAGSAVDSLALCITLDGTTTNSLTYRSVSKTGTTYTYELSDTDRAFLRNATPNSNTLQVGFYLRTIIGGVEYYSKVWKTLTIINASPVLTPTITDINEDIVMLTGGDTLVRYHSNAYFRIGARAQKGATLKSQSVTCGGVTLEGAEGTFADVQSGDFVFTATDSRGNTTTQTVQLPFVEYVSLTCSIGNGKPDTDGDFTLTASGICYNGDIGGAGNNDLYVLYRYKVSGGSYSDWSEMSVSRDGDTYTARANFSGLDYRTTYIFQCMAGDLVTAATTEEKAIKSMPVFDWSGEDFNFNVPVKAPSLDVNTINLGGVGLDGPTLEGVISDFIVEQGEKSSWLYRKWNSGIMECWRRVQVTTNVTSAWGSLYSSGALSATNLTYPYAFTETPYLTVTLMPFGSGGLIMAPGSAYGSTTQTGSFEIARGTSMSSVQYLIAYHAIGKWK